MRNLIILATILIIGCTKNTTINNNNPTLVKPILTTNPISIISNTSALSGGTFIDDGGSNIISKGLCWSINRNPTINDFKSLEGGGVTNYTSAITGLSRNTNYYVRAYANNSIGTGYGNELTFTTTDSTTTIDSTLHLPTVVMNNINSITTSTAIVFGSVTNQGSSSVTAKGFQYFNIPNSNAGWQTLSLGTGLGSYSKNLSSLSPNTTYYVKAYATNSYGTAYSSEQSFSTANLVTTVTDIDGNIYNTVTIGSQVWMKENLKVTKYKDGTAISNITDNTQWTNLTTGAYCYYDNNSGFNNTYGKLYNWYATNDSRGLAPAGWHIPSESEWITLMNFLGGQSVCGGALKATSLWNSPNTGATNSSGFTAVAAGFRFDDTGTFTFSSVGSGSYFWSTKQISSTTARGYTLNYNYTWLANTDVSKPRGFSIRCIKD